MVKFLFLSNDITYVETTLKKLHFYYEKTWVFFFKVEVSFKVKLNEIFLKVEKFIENKFNISKKNIDFHDKKLR